MSADRKPSEKISLEDAMRSVANGLRSETEVGVTVEEILDYHAGRMNGPDAEDLRRRLSLNREAARLAADLACFPDIEASEEVRDRVTGSAERQWQTLTRRIDREKRAPRYGAPFGWRAQWLPPVLAAALILVLIGSGSWIVSLKQRIAELTGPGGNVLVETLRSEEIRQREASAEPQKVQLQTAEGGLVLLLAFSDPDDGLEYRAEIADAEGRHLWSRGELRIDPHKNLSLSWPRDRMTSGRYRIVVFPQGENKERIARFDLILESP